MIGKILFVEKAFDLNDWFVIGCIIIFYSVVFILPKRFTRSTALLLFLFSPTIASMLDNSIGGHIFDMYDIMDGPAYTVMDFTVYFLYAPFGYFFIYIYDRYQFRGIKTVVYIFLWSCLAAAFELLCWLAGVFHYKGSYGIYYSFCIYLFSQSLTIKFYHFISKRNPSFFRS